MKNLNSSTKANRSTAEDSSKSHSPTLPSITQDFFGSGKFSGELSDENSFYNRHVSSNSPNRITEDTIVKSINKVDLPIESDTIKKSKSLTRKIKELTSAKGDSLKLDLNSVKSNLFPNETEKILTKNNGIAPIVPLSAKQSTSSESNNESNIMSLGMQHPSLLQPLASCPLKSANNSAASGGNLSHQSSPMTSMSGKHTHMNIPTLTGAQPSEKQFLSSNGSNIGDFSPLVEGKSSAKLASISPSVLSGAKQQQQSVRRKGSFSDISNGGSGGEVGSVGMALAMMAGSGSRSRGGSSSAEEREAPQEGSQLNDRLIQDRLQEAKALSRRDDHGAVMHTFSLWKKPHQQPVAVPAPALLVTPTKLITEPPSIGDSIKPQRPLSAGRVLRGPKAAISQLAASDIGDNYPSATSASTTTNAVTSPEPKVTTVKEPRSSNKTRLYSSLLSQSALPCVDTSLSVEGPLLGTLIIAPMITDIEEEEEEGSVAADDDWSAYSSDFESALDEEFGEGIDQLAVVGVGLQRGLASSLRSKVGEAKTKDSRSSRDFSDSTTLATRMSTSLPVGGFGAVMAADAQLEDGGASGALNFSRSIDSGSFAKAMARGEELDEYSGHMPVFTAESNSASTSSALRSQSVQLLSLPEDNAAASIARIRSASIGSTVQATAISKPLTSMTARPASQLVPTMSGDTPSKRDPSRSKANAGPTSKYQTLRQLKGSRPAEELVVTSFDSSCGVVSAKEEEEEVGRADCSSPTLSELSEVGEDLLAAVRPERVDRGTDSHTMTPIGKAHKSTDDHTFSETVTAEGISDRNRSSSSSSSSPLQWKKGEAIGEGTFGKVFKGLNEKTGELLAIKQLCIADGSEHEVESLQREIRVMWDLDCEFIVRYLGTSRSDRYLFIVLEYVTGGSIAGMLSQFGVFSENLVRRFSLQIVTGVDYLHTKGIIHRDIKGANILVTEGGVAKLADFGCSKQLAGMCTASLEESLRAIRGSVPWMAPEVIKQSGHGRAADIWSLGATLIEMTTGKPPWPEFTNNLAALFHVATSKLPPPLPAQVSVACADLMRRCLVIEAADRATAQELLRMPFLSTTETKLPSNSDA